jgi:LuxR family maltose regulon positive regulatory protein
MEPLLRTKLYTPDLRPGEWVARPRLSTQLDESLRRKLTLISAPAGFGKTTVVTDWLHRRSLQAAWLSLDEGDNEPVLFWRYIIAALQTIQPELGVDLLRALQATPEPPIELVLTALINEISMSQQRWILVLDDYHTIDNRTIDQGMTFLVEHIPPNLHLIMTSRIDPVLPLSRLRVRGELMEIRTGDLRFTHQEAVDFFNQITGLHLSPANVAALEARTEGWVAGLQMAALSLKNNQDVSAFIDAFSGSHRYIMDYLVDEVLERQSPDIRSFLLHTSILERLCGELCAAVVEQNQDVEIHRNLAPLAQSVLVDLHRRNLFLVALDDQNCWFRYHHLFADLLRRRLQQSGVDVAALHRGASRWFEQQQLIEEALHHALAAQEWTDAARLLEAPANEALRYGRVQWTEERLAALPESEVNTRPNLLMAQAWVYYFKQQPERLARTLDQVETLTHHVPEESRRQQLWGQISLLRAWVVRSHDLQQSADLLRQALDLLPQDDTNYRGLAHLFLGSVLEHQGHFEKARQFLELGVEICLRADNLSAYLGAHSLLADLERRQGEVQRARQRLETLVRWAQEKNLHYLPSLAEIHSALARIFWDQNDLKQATQHLEAAFAQTEQGITETRATIFMKLGYAYLEVARGNGEAGRQLLQQVGEQSLHWPPSLERRNLATDLARLYLQLGNLSAAEQWWRETGIHPDQPLKANTPEAWNTLVRLRLAQHRERKTELPTADLLNLLADLAQCYTPLLGHQLEFALLEALVHGATGETEAARTALLKAIVLAEPQNHVRLFLEGGEPIRQLLLTVVNANVATPVRNYAAALLNAFPDSAGEAARSTQIALHLNADEPSSGLLAPLTERELDTLRLLATELSIPEIASELVVTASTVRSYCKRIYSKLDAHSRIEAVARAQQLQLL